MWGVRKGGEGFRSCVSQQEGGGGREARLTEGKVGVCVYVGGVGGGRRVPVLCQPTGGKGGGRARLRVNLGYVWVCAWVFYGLVLANGAKYKTDLGVGGAQNSRW